MKKWSDKKHTLAIAVAWTFSAILAITAALFRDVNPLQNVIAVLFTLDAVIWWAYYAKKRQEEQEL